MMYYLQFPAGSLPILEDVLQQRIGKFHVRFSDDSSILFDSKVPPKQIASLSFVKNAFLVVADEARGKSIEDSIRRLSNRLRSKDLAWPRLTPRGGGFRTMVHIDGQLAPISSRDRAALTTTIERATGQRLLSRGGGQEYWIIGRREFKRILFCARLARSAPAQKAAGALSAELSAMIVAASSPRPNDVVLDPFAGSGALLGARSEYPSKTLIYNDLALKEHRGRLDARLKGKHFTALAEDAFNLRGVPSGSVDVVITDPPWGEYEELETKFAEWAQQFAALISRVLRPESKRFVVLINRRNSQALKDALRHASLPASRSLDILVNGHPATILIRSE